MSIFTIKGLKDYRGRIIKDEYYTFVDGVTIWSNNIRSSCYENYTDFIKNNVALKDYIVLVSEVYNNKELLNLLVNNKIKNKTVLKCNNKVYYVNVYNNVSTLYDLSENKEVGLSFLLDRYKEFEIYYNEEDKWEIIPKFTKVQVRDFENEMWRNMYFIKYINDAPEDDYKFLVSLIKTSDEFTEVSPELYSVPYMYCRLYTEE